jgi:hypothetical protein
MSSAGNFQPGKLWSLWDMLKIDGSVFYEAMSTIAKIRAIGDALPNDESLKKKLSQSVKPNTIQVMKDRLTSLKRELETMGARMTELAVDRAVHVIDSDAVAGDLGRACGEIDSRMMDELSLINLYVVDVKNAHFLGDEPSKNPFGDSVAEKFPSSTYDISEAAKCLAVRRWTASVTHLMRALEPALNSLANAINVPFERTNWQNILDQIEKEIRQRSKQPPFPDWKEDEQFYSESAAYFRILKDAWRNHAMHLRDKYDEDRADAVFQSVRNFMRHL